MSQSVTLNSSTYTIPDVGENDWGQNVTDFLVAIPGAVLQKSGGTFTLTAEVDFGVTYGLKSAYFKSRAASPASAGAVRLGVADVVSWRNNGGGGNLDLGVDAADALTFASNKVVTVAGGFTSVATNSYANQKGIRFLEQTANGTNYIEIVAPDAVTANTTLKLPDGAGTSGQVLSTDGSGVLSWINAAGGGTINTGVIGRLAIYSISGTTLDDVVTLTNTVSVVIATHGQGSVYTIPDTGAATADFVMTAGTQTIAGAKTFTGNISISHSSTGAFQLSNASTLIVDSTNALVSIGTTTRTYPLYISKSSAGANVTMAVENSESANAASHARLYVVTGGASGGDPFMTFYNGVANWSVGLDNSDSDALCITGAATLNGTNIWRLSSAGLMTTVAGVFTDTSNQLVLGTTRTVTISAPTPASSSRTWTIPDISADGTFMALQGTQTITGTKTFSAAVTINPTSNQLVLGVTQTVTITAPTPASSSIYTIPDVGTSASFVMTAGTQTIGGAKTYTGLAGFGGVAAVNEPIEVHSAVSSVFRGNASFYDSTALAAGVGGEISFGGKYTGSTYSEFASIQGTKKNATDGNLDAQLVLRARSASGGLWDIVTLDGNTQSAVIHGTNTNDSAAAGIVGELINSNIARSGFVTLSANTAKNVTSIILTAGDWDIRGTVGLRTVGNTTVMVGAINTTTDAVPTGDTFANPSNGVYAIWMDVATVAGSKDFCIPIPPSRVKLTGNTTYYLVAQSDAANHAYGYIEARRVR